MSWRTIIISKRAKLDLKLNYLVVRGTDTTRVFLDEISTIIIESTAVSLTAALLQECTNRKIKIIFCDVKHNPNCELISYYGAYDSSRKLRQQIRWQENTKQQLWTLIVKDKIIKQSNLLKMYNLINYRLLDEYVSEIEIGDKTNREGHAAKVYFNALFGKDFCRDDNNTINAALNYGYTILLSAFNREIVANGYNTQLGIFHDNVLNYFNLSSDLMESFRPIIDFKVKENIQNNFGKDEKRLMLSIFENQYYIKDKKYYLQQVISIYVKSVFEVLETNDLSKFRCYRNEL